MSGFHAFAEHVGHGGQDGSKIKTGTGLWIHLILICTVWGIQTYILSPLLTKDRQLYLMAQIFGDRQKEAMFSAPSAKPCVLHVFVFPNFTYTELSVCDLRPKSLLCFSRVFIPPETIVHGHLLQDIDLYFYLLHMLLALITAQLQLCAHEAMLLELFD